ncbi:ATP-binding protein [Methylotuvimicrobium alcaliphilum]|uniref:histidine kinase n=1 Tax=Methylotuvimicrobium alcaliphilum (strain DSM 19304 / NCIMB 14124 / VKM B-2133 / 20Z) TaxID=1091494 RepID=G4T0V5_META2|nr:ATP-binding protein [Methylotuvimicrobium alcaliphilum]CCE23389.1 two-component signal transduction system response, histidine kinase sensor [Methylotuvimicrobium alcaliphilum 20Z]
MLKFRTRLILSHLAVIVVILTSVGFAAYWMLSRAVYNQLDAALLAVAETEAAVLSSSPYRAIKLNDTLSGSDRLSFARIDRLIQVVDSEGKVLAQSANLGNTQLPVLANLSALFANSETVFETLFSFGDEPVRMVSMPIDRLDTPVIVQVAGSLDDVHNVLNVASLLFVMMTLGLLTAVAGVGLSLTRKAFQAIENIVQRAQHINEANLNERLPHPGSRDEIGNLVDTLNEMLDRIERSFEVQRRFTADASHELRSPLSRLRTELEISLRRSRDPSEYHETLQSCMDEVERLTLIVEELLVLARMDAGLERRSTETVSLNAIVEATVKRMQSMAGKRDVQIIAEPMPQVVTNMAYGSVDLILTNLLDNAVKFSPPGGRVSVRLVVTENEAALSVCDNGPGIDQDEQQRIFERFYRGSVASTRHVAGAGLGLALSQAIACGHGGYIEMTNNDEGGSFFIFKFPLAR